MSSSLTSLRHPLWSTCLGNLFEHYDTALFGFLSPFLAPLIFPQQDPLTALILTYAIIPIGMIARPLGSLVFGYIGHVHGLHYALFLTLAGMAFVSLGMACTPTYMQAGILAPILFCLGKALQNFLSAGETMGGAIFLLQHSSEKRHDLLSSLYSASTMLGHFLASLGVVVISHYQIVHPGWRLLYLMGSLTAVFGCLIRWTCPLPFIPLDHRISLKSILLTCKKPLLAIMLTSGFAYANYAMALVLLNGFIPLVSSLTKTEMMEINTYMLILDFCALPFFGWLASKMARERMMLSAALGVILCSIPLFLLLENASLALIIGIRIVFVLIGVAFFAPFHAWAGQLIPPSYRYTVISLGYALGSQLLGGPTAAFALWCFQKTGLVASLAWYWIVLASASSLAILATLRVKNSQLVH